MKKNSDFAWWQPGLILFARLSVWIAVPVIVAMFVGRKLDKFFYTAPWLFFLCVGVAFTISMVMIVKIGLKEMEKMGNADKKSKV